jgi:glutamate-1-semialdehyde 2,1-aminomutase
MKIIAIVQARLGSKRFPKKVIQKIGDYSAIELLLMRLSKSQYIEKIVVATTSNPEDKELTNIINQIGYETFAGSEEDVLDRFYQISKIERPEIIVRITGDCPFIDSSIVDEVIFKLIETKSDYCSNNLNPTFPDGFDVEAFLCKPFEKVWEIADKKFDREHVTPFFYNNPDKYKISSVKSKNNNSSIRLTLDESVDLIVLRKVFEELEYDCFFEYSKIVDLIENKKHLFMANSEIRRNEGSLLGSGQKLWKRAKKIIPGGNMLLSKRTEMFLPDYWPSYFSKAKGVEVWDLDNNKFIDMSIMGIGTNTLGYGNVEVDDAVMNVVKSGNMSTLNCPEEVLLAEKLVELHPWADMVKLTRSGGEANAVALRIARAASGKDSVAICGYHGWHDWYLAANLNTSSELNGHLMPGLEPNGVPRALLNTVHTFNYNDLEGLRKLVDSNNNIGVIFMEVMRNFEPSPGFLEGVRKLANEKNIVLIFDECTSGFRETYGGLHLKYGVEPDLAMFGKAMGNGYAINAIIGKREVMEAAQSTFISSTFWTERIGPTAAITTLNVMKEIKSWEIITKIGNGVKRNWEKIALNNSVDIEINGLPSLLSFNFKSKNAIYYKTYLTQEMLKKGILASNTLYSCTEHSQRHLDIYYNELNEIFNFIKNHPDDMESFLDGPQCHSGFKRLN